MISILFDNLDEVLKELEKNLNYEMLQSSQEVAEITAREAKSYHWFNNRTGNLEASIKANTSSGEFSSDKITIEVDANMPYGKTIQKKEDFILEAYNRQKTAIIEAIEKSLSKAASNTESFIGT